MHVLPSMGQSRNVGRIAKEVLSLSTILKSRQGHGGSGIKIHGQEHIVKKIGMAAQIVIMKSAKIVLFGFLSLIASSPF